MIIIAKTKRILFLNSFVLKAWINVFTWVFLPFLRYDLGATVKKQTLRQ
ncbi:hypothetical protein CGSMWGv55152_05674 [Gardnerella vaginalis 55152]|uniref:Uncharacterized protein n=1 Tax=Gardnerella vaginalis 55152 TaxID=698955 RepID=I4LRM3_GARVA|nr:hypothetical protein CGSMWGv284V_06049 [Gardnerella vaginalis 284V]EIK74585.1 hypothetical protein CGSMWGv75712_01865 [Gardnerella vaginalis 75712]EIK79613.1 hypothetical protein CGSMWGv55152_05674 [Gardnerella vaginalis 55152]